MKIPLFDIDGTLLKEGSASELLAEAYHVALTQIYNLPQASLLDRGADSDGWIQNHVFLFFTTKYGIPKEEALKKLPQARDVLAAYFLTHKERENAQAHNGAKALLEDLQQHRIPCGVLTGNNKPICMEKLKQAGLEKYIAFGAFGDMALTRVELIPVAQKEYKKVFGEERPLTDFVIIGDTPRDIQCAKQGGILSIGVPTGNYSAEVLEKEKPDLLVNSLEEKEKILSYLMS